MCSSPPPESYPQTVLLSRLLSSNDFITLPLCPLLSTRTQPGLFGCPDCLRVNTSLWTLYSEKHYTDNILQDNDRRAFLHSGQYNREEARVMAMSPHLYWTRPDICVNLVQAICNKSPQFPNTNQWRWEVLMIHTTDEKLSQPKTLSFSVQHCHIHLVFYQCFKNTTEKSVFEFKFHKKTQLKSSANTTTLRVSEANKSTKLEDLMWTISVNSRNTSYNSGAIHVISGTKSLNLWIVKYSTGLLAAKMFNQPCTIDVSHYEHINLLEDIFTDKQTHITTITSALRAESKGGVHATDSWGLGAFGCEKSPNSGGTWDER